MSIENQHSGEQNKVNFNDNTNIELQNLLENINSMSNTKELLDFLTQSILKNYINKLQTKEGINLSINNIYTDIIDILDGLENSIGFDNIYNGKINIIKENFLLPETKGKQILNYTIDTILFPELNTTNEITDIDIKHNFLILKSAIGTIIDFSKTSTKEEIMQFVEEFSNIDEIKNILENHSDLKVLFLDLVPSIANTLDKEYVLELLDNFINTSRSDLITVSNHLKTGNIKDKEQLFDSKLNIISNIGKLSTNLLNKQNTEVFIQCTNKLDLIQNNELLKQGFDLLNSDKLSPEIKYDLAKQLFNGIELFTNKNISEKEVNKYFNELIKIIVNLGDILGPHKIANYLVKIFGLNNNENIEVNNDIQIDYNIELVKLLWENTDRIPELINKIFNNELNSSKNIVNYLLVSGILKENIQNAGGKLIERIRNIINTDLETIIIEIRKDYIINDFKTTKKEKDKCIDKLLIECKTDFISKLTIEIIEELKNTIKDKIKSNINHNLKQEEIINIVKTVLLDYITNNDTEYINFLKSLGIKLQDNDQEKLIINFTKDILNNEKFIEIINTIINSIGNNLGNSKDIAKSIKNLIDTAGGNYIGDFLVNNTDTNIDLGINFLYSKLLNNQENIKNLINIINNNTELNLNINEVNYPKLLEILKTHLDSDNLKDFIKQNYDKLLSGNLTKKDINNLGLDLYELINNKTDFLIKIMQSCEVDNKIKCKTPDGLSKSENLDIDRIIGLLYLTLNENESNNILINNILDYFNLNDIQNINIFGQSFGENILIFLKTIKKEDLIIILNQYKNELTKITNPKNQTEKNQLLLKIGIDIITVIDTELLQKELSKNDISNGENLLLYLTDDFQKIIKNYQGDIKNLAEKTRQLYEAHNSGWSLDIDNKIAIDLLKNEYGKKIFNIIHDILSGLQKDFLKNNLKFDGNGKTNKRQEDLIQKFKDAFISNNFGFSLFGLGLGNFIANGFNFDTIQAINDYFLDKSNSDDFADTIKDFYSKKYISEEKKESWEM